MAEIIDEVHLAAWRAFINAHASVIDRIEEELAEAGQLPLTSYDVLVALSESPDHRLRMNELAHKVVVLSRSGVTRLVDRLEAEGLLYRERTAADRRGAYAVITQKGLAALDRARPVYARGIVEHFARHLDDAEVDTLRSALERIDAAARGLE
jgi:DNA-binding MarR family transcriptional regulator